MNLRNIVNRMLGRREWRIPSKLRNKPGGMAWVRMSSDAGGQEVANGAAVKTVSFDGYWVIEPKLPFVATRFQRDPRGTILHKGERGVLVGCFDDELEPWRDIGDHEKDESTAWLPAAPKATPAQILGLPVREMSLPVTDPVDEELADAISHLFHLTVNDAERALRAASNHPLRLVVGTAPTELGRPL